MPATSCCGKWAAPGQAKIREAKVLIVGAGGLGSPLRALSGGGGRGPDLGLVDDDAVSLSNLQRQILFTTADVGRPRWKPARRTWPRSIPASR